MEELATVTEISDDKITVVSQIKSTCNSCSQVDSCASGQVAKAIPHKRLSFTLSKPSSLNDTSIQVGDCVVLTVPEIDVLQSAWQVYLLPILGLFLFSGLGQWFIQVQILPHELFALALGVFGGYLGFRFAKILQSHPLKRKRLQPEILKVIPKPIVVSHISGNQ